MRSGHLLPPCCGSFATKRRDRSIHEESCRAGVFMSGLSRQATASASASFQLKLRSSVSCCASRPSTSPAQDM
nr:hypothetical protein CFP56_02789 [Quercus suber]